MQRVMPLARQRTCSLGPQQPGYTPRYAGGVFERDSAYHQGTLWPWLSGPFIEAWVKSRGNTPAAQAAARLDHEQRRALSLPPLGPLAIAIVINAQLLYPGAQSRSSFRR